jgi:uncharacterized protein (DUF1684 family)
LLSRILINVRKFHERQRKMENDSGIYRLLRVVALLCIISALLATTSRSQDGAWQRDLADWREQHAVELQKPDSWLALIGLEWLEPGDNSFGSAADSKIHLPIGAPLHLGILHLEGTTVSLRSPTSGFPEGFLIDGKPAAAQTLHSNSDSDKNDPRLTIGTLTMYVISRGERFALRIKDSKSTALSSFHGLRWYSPNARYRVTARWIPYNPPRSTTLATLIGTSYSQPVPGAAEFRLAGKTYRLEPVLEDPAEAKLFFIIRDTTSTSTTYGACRFLYTGFPDNGLAHPGTLVLDLNQLENPPCAYTPYATCPLPPPGNRLPIPIPVGEKRYHD